MTDLEDLWNERVGKGVTSDPHDFTVQCDKPSRIMYPFFSFEDVQII